MLARFEVKNIRLGGPVFDLTKLKWLNGEYIRAPRPKLLPASATHRSSERRLPQPDRPLVQTRIETLGEFGDLTHFFFPDNVLPTAGGLFPKKRTLEDTLAFAAEQLTVLEATDWTHEAWNPRSKN